MKQIHFPQKNLIFLPTLKDFAKRIASRFKKEYNAGIHTEFRGVISMENNHLHMCPPIQGKVE